MSNYFTLVDFLTTSMPLANGLFDSRALVFTLWVGLGLLTLSLLILMWTRWGHARPLSKCVGLSVLAHVLLLGYAYGTNLFLDSPPPVVEDIVRLTIDPDKRKENNDRLEKSTPLWDQFEAKKFSVPETAILQRQVTSNVKLQRTVAMTQQPDIAVDENELPQPDRSIQPSNQPSHIEAIHVKKPGTSPSKIEVPQVHRRENKTSFTIETKDPKPVSPSRASDLPAKRDASQNLPIKLFDPMRSLQRLTDVEAKSKTSDAVTDDQDRLHASGRQTTDSTQQNVVSSRQSPKALVSLGGPASDTAASSTALNVADSGTPPLNSSRPDISTSAVPRRLGDGEAIPLIYRARISSQRLLDAQRFGGTPESEAAVDAALKWLAVQQTDDGRWDADAYGAGHESRVLGHDRQGAGTHADTGITGLALLAFLARGNSHLEGKYRGNVKQGLEYLLRTQHQDGNLAGQAKLYAVMYCHSMASLALSEAYAITGDSRLQPYVEKAIQYSIKSQHPSGGGWRYQPADLGDMSQFGWQVMALKSAQRAGIEIPQSTQLGMKRFLSRCSLGRHNGLASYRPGGQATRTMTAEALTCRFFLNVLNDPETVSEAAHYVVTQPPGDGPANLYYWYYGTLALFQMQNDQWQHWNTQLQRQLLLRQRTTGPLAGSWDADTVWGSYGGRVYSTAMAALCLEVYYRYLPIFQDQKMTE